MEKIVVILALSNLIACTNKKEEVVKSNDSYTVIKENGNEKIVTKDSDEVVVNTSDLPEKVTQFIKNNFGNETLQNSIKEADPTGDEYKIQLSNGVKIDFDSNGDWKQIEAGVANQSVDLSFLPEVTIQYLKQNYPNIAVKSIDRDVKGIDVELWNKIDLKFDGSGKFLKVD